MKRFFRKKKRIDWRELARAVGDVLSKIWRWLLQVWARLSGEVRRRRVVAKMQKADILLASPRTLSLSPVAFVYRLLLRSRYVHSMLYIGNGKIVHTTTRHGVVVARLPRKIFRADRYAIFRAKNLDAAQRDRIILEALKSKDKRLDHAGLITNVPARLLGLRKPLVRWERNRLWCSKLIYRAFLAAGVEIVPPDKAENITSEDLSRSEQLRRV